nr:MAG TPA: HNH endonuclease [Caudoviricetes sp.]
MKLCKIEGCNCERYPGVGYCHKHYLERKAEQRKQRKAEGKKVRTTYTCMCIGCGKEFQGTRKTSLFCSKICFNKNKSNEGTNPYVYDSDNYKQNLWQHRNIAENILGRKLSSNEIVHHLDGNPQNNALTNLIVLSRSKHASLHHYLNIQRALLEQSRSENSENCWNNLIVPMTTTWLETANVKVKKLWEIGQSAAEPLSNEEGSETMYGTSLVDDDIVQTTTP